MSEDASTKEHKYVVSPKISPNSTEKAALDPAAVIETPEVDEPIGRFSRRNLLRWVIGLGVGAFGLSLALPTLALKALSQVQRPVEAGDVLVYSAGGQRGQAIRPENLQVNNSVQVLPQNKTEDTKNLIQLVRIAPGQGVEGLVAYSAICTHLGCSVLASLGPNNSIACPCHASLFDPRNDAAPVGGPANRPLPSLPIGVGSDGAVIATGTFEAPIGPQS